MPGNLPPATGSNSASTLSEAQEDEYAEELMKLGLLRGTGKGVCLKTHLGAKHFLVLDVLGGARVGPSLSRCSRWGRKGQRQYPDEGDWE